MNGKRIRPKQEAIVKTNKTEFKPLRIPHELMHLVKDADNKSAALIELMRLGAKVKYGEDFAMA